MIKKKIRNFEKIQRTLATVPQFSQNFSQKSSQSSRLLQSVSQSSQLVTCHTHNNTQT
jgi:cell fate (sporulation/competence/biofilm development) regulator YlbF (YheA/YmcA/DUF963 family)